MTPKNVKGIEKLVKKIFLYLNSYQIVNLAGMVYALIHASSPLISEVARVFPYGKNYRHKRKRIERFLRNERCLFNLCKIQYLKWVIGLIPWKKKQMIIMDYTFLGRYMILWAAIPFNKRALPIHFTIIRNPHVTNKRQKDRMIIWKTIFSASYAFIFHRIEGGWWWQTVDLETRETLVYVRGLDLIMCFG